MAPLHAYFDPSAIEHGESSLCIVEGFPRQLHGTTIQVQLQSVDDVATSWVADIGSKIDSVGTAVAKWEPSLKGEQVAELTQVYVPPKGLDAKPQRIWETPQQVEVARCLLGRRAELSAKELERLADEFREKQSTRCARSFGDQGDRGAIEFEAVCVVERLLITTPMRLPGVEILPLGVANAGTHEADLLNQVFAALGQGERMDPGGWAQHSEASRPWTALRVKSIWAESNEAAAALAARVRERALHLLAVGRGASGVPVATLIRPVEAEQPGGIFPELPGYTGNLLGGFLSGEDQHSLLVKNEAIERDPVVALATKLYREARAEINPDFAYFRYWSLLELVSDARIPPKQPVVLVDGRAWPDGGSTSAAAPRVYELLKVVLQKSDHQSHVSPAPDLYEAVRGWYGRRNATAHYGAFDPTSSAQQKQSWFKWASKSVQGENPIAPAGEPWLWGLRETATLLVERELHSTGDL